MTASRPAVDRPTPSVAIVGTDAVLAAAPATPVQVAHACLRRGFTVAVPASWGDELLAAETLRCLATRERGPAVMCVCPSVRARLLGPGPDLAPFLVSLVPPPVAVARYLRSVYGEHGVHLTYIGSCPGADDASIDARLTPDAFIAELAELGIALAEQPLVFDSIVPPDRRRWCSLPGGVPNAEMLWADTDGRTLVEMERTDATELAQHIIAGDHVLLDLAPGLGCACSGAVGPVTPDRARAVAAAVEPPRALSPVIDPDAAALVSLEVPVRARTPATPPLVLPPPLRNDTALERVLDELLGASAADSRDDQPTAAPLSGSSIILDLPQLPPEPPGPVRDAAVGEPRTPTPPERPELTGRHVSESGDSSSLATAGIVTGAPSARESMRQTLPARELAVEPAPASQSVAVAAEGPATLGGDPSAPAEVRPPESGATQSIPRTPHDPTVLTEVMEVIEVAEVAEVIVGDGPAESGDTHVRRRTPPAMLRFSGSAIPKASVANGRPLPRAYVAKRRTPPVGAAAISPADRSAEESRPAAAPETIAPTTAGIAAGPTPAASDEPAASPETTSPPAERESSHQPASAPVDAASGPKSTSVPAASSGPRGSTAPSTTHPALVFLLVSALVALAVFVVLTLQ